MEKAVTIGGKKVHFYGKTTAEINRKITEYKDKAESGELFSVVADRWKEEHFPTLATNTLKGYIPAHRRAVEHFGNDDIKSITPADVKQYLSGFPKSWAQKTYRNYYLVLRQIFDYAAANEYIGINPAEYIQIPKGLRKTHRRAPTPEEIEAIKNGLSLSFGLFPFFLLYTGCRLGEALAIQFRDIDRKNKVIHITKSVYFVSNQPEIKRPKTEKGIRDVILLDVLANVIPNGKPDDYLFGGEELLTQSKYRHLMKSYVSAASIPDITPHILRHGYATILHEAGIDPKEAQKLLGHAQLSTTMDTYTHITNQLMKKAEKKLNEFVKSS